MSFRDDNIEDIEFYNEVSKILDKFLIVFRILLICILGIFIWLIGKFIL